MKKKNFLLISLDTVRADVAYSGKFKSIEKLRKQGATFLNTISSSPLTPVSHATVLTGLQPYNHGIRHLFKEQLNKKVKTLGQVVKAAGYKTAAIVSCPGMNKWYGFCKGFDHYDDEIPRLADGSDPLKTVDVKKRGTALKRAELVVSRATEWIDENKDKDFFLFLHFFDAHWPYKVPEKHGGDNIYENAIAYADHYLGRFLEHLEELGLLDTTTILCFSDHGEDLAGLYPNDKGGRKLGHPEESGHGCLLYDQTQKTLLMIVDKDVKPGITIKSQVRLVDVFPTILEILKIKMPADISDGVSLLPFLKNKFYHELVGYSETFYPEEQNAATGGKFPKSKKLKALRVDNKYKIIFHLESDRVEIYDLIKDPNEQNNLISFTK
jgi:arylsulfatase A-like enzyme